MFYCCITCFSFSIICWCMLCASVCIRNHQQASFDLSTSTHLPGKDLLSHLWKFCGWVNIYVPLSNCWEWTNNVCINVLIKMISCEALIIEWQIAHFSSAINLTKLNLSVPFLNEDFSPFRSVIFLWPIWKWFSSILFTGEETLSKFWLPTYNPFSLIQRNLL